MNDSMSIHDDESQQGVVLTSQQAFLAMTDYVWRFAQSAGDDLLTMLGDTRMERDGGPTDPAAWEDWKVSVRLILGGKNPREE